MMPLLVAPGGGRIVIVEPSSETLRTIAPPASNVTLASGLKMYGSGAVMTVWSLAFGPVDVTVATGTLAGSGLTKTGIVISCPAALTLKLVDTRSEADTLNCHVAAVAGTVSESPTNCSKNVESRTTLIPDPTAETS